jgi:hypothetical protein
MCDPGAGPLLLGPESHNRPASARLRGLREEHSRPRGAIIDPWNPLTSSVLPSCQQAWCSTRWRTSTAGPTWASPSRAHWAPSMASSCRRPGPSASWRASGHWWPPADGGSEDKCVALIPDLLKASASSQASLEQGIRHAREPGTGPKGPRFTENPSNTQNE